jgi:hypothetical protein
MSNPKENVYWHGNLLGEVKWTGMDHSYVEGHLEMLHIDTRNQFLKDYGAWEKAYPDLRDRILPLKKGFLIVELANKRSCLVVFELRNILIDENDVIRCEISGKLGPCSEAYKMKDQISKHAKTD